MSWVIPTLVILGVIYLITLVVKAWKKIISVTSERTRTVDAVTQTQSDAYAARLKEEAVPTDAYAAKAQDVPITVFKKTGAKYHTSTQCYILKKHLSDGTVYTKCLVCDTLDKKHT